MTPELPTAMLTVSRLDGSGKTWRVQLTPQTPFGMEELKSALVERFISPEATPDDFELKTSGTLGSPLFELQEKKGDKFGVVEEL
ncbi:hypothetical protein [Kocuria marina]|uniref:hypothetical protein n=1 Tax=Kocuria marina TaxID=223184 RepID=UPI0012EB56F3|nr:hypothetical protein [Kocuria marina]